MVSMPSGHRGAQRGFPGKGHPPGVSNAEVHQVVRSGRKVRPRDPLGGCHWGVHVCVWEETGGQGGTGQEMTLQPSTCKAVIAIPRTLLHPHLLTAPDSLLSTQQPEVPLKPKV